MIIAAAPIGVEPPPNMDNTADNIYSAVKLRKQATFEERALIQNNSAGIAVKTQRTLNEYEKRLKNMQMSSH